MEKKRLVLAITLASLGAVWTGTASAAAQAETAKGTEPGYELPDIVIRGERAAQMIGETFTVREGSVGILGTQDTMATPFTTTNITRETLDSFGSPSQPLDSVLAVSPSVRGTGSVLHNDFQLRGFRSNGSSSYVNGVPDMFTQFNAPLYVVERADIVSGPNSGLSGTMSRMRQAVS